MKEKVKVFIIGVLVGAILATGAFLIYNSSNSNNQTPGGNPPSMPSGENGEPPEKPSGENGEPPERPNGASEATEETNND